MKILVITKHAYVKVTDQQAEYYKKLMQESPADIEEQLITLTEDEAPLNFVVQDDLSSTVLLAPEKPADWSDYAEAGDPEKPK